MRVWLISFAAILVLLTIGASIFLVGQRICAVLSETESTIKETRETISELKQRIKEAKAVESQLKFAIMSWHGVSFDLRKNWTANEKVQERTIATLERLTAAADKAINTLVQEFTLTMNHTRDTIIPSAEAAIKGMTDVSAQLKTSIADLSKETCATIAEVRPVLKTTEQTVAKLQPIMENGNGIMGNLNSISQRVDNVVAKYEKTILHPSWKQSVKGIFQLVLSGFNLWADMRLIW